MHSLGALFGKKPCFGEKLVDGLLLEVSDGFWLVKVVADLGWSDGDHWEMLTDESSQKWQRR